MTAETLAAAREAICAVFGVLPGLLSPATTGPMVREAQRHLAQWQLMPMAALVSQEATEKLGQDVSIDVMRPLQAYDAGGRSRALATIVEAMARAKEVGLAPGAPQFSSACGPFYGMLYGSIAAVICSYIESSVISPFLTLLCKVRAVFAGIRNANRLFIIEASEKASSSLFIAFALNVSPKAPATTNSHHFLDASIEKIGT
jgi:hypothetical protein